MGFVKKIRMAFTTRSFSGVAGKLKNTRKLTDETRIGAPISHDAEAHPRVVDGRLFMAIAACITTNRLQQLAYPII